MNEYAKFRCASLLIKEALGIFRELIPRATRRRTTREWLLGTRLSGPKRIFKLTKGSTSLYESLSSYGYKCSATALQEVKVHTTS